MLDILITAQHRLSQSPCNTDGTFPRSRGEDVRRWLPLKSFAAEWWTWVFSTCLSLWVLSVRPALGVIPAGWLPSWSSADVSCLMGGVNLITCGIVNVTNGALSLVNVLYAKHRLADAWTKWARDGTNHVWPRKVKSCRTGPGFLPPLPSRALKKTQTLNSLMNTVCVAYVKMWPLLSVF